MDERAQPSQHHPTHDRSHEASLDQLAEYATALALGEPAAQRFPTVAAHLAQCSSCRQELDQLLALVEPIYTAAIEPLSETPRVDLSFLQLAPSATHPVPRLRDSLRRLAVAFSEQLITSLRAPTLAHSARGDALFRYTPKPPQGNPQLTIEVFAADGQPDQVSVQVLVDLTDRSPLEQAGVLVTLTMGELRLTAHTEATGSVIFPAVPLAGLAEMRIEVEVPEA